MTTLPPSKALVRDLQIAVHRLVRRATVMNIGINLGMPVAGLDFIIAPVEDSCATVRRLIAEAEAAGVDLDILQAQVSKPISDELAGIFADAIGDNAVPDDISSLLDEGGSR